MSKLDVVARYGNWFHEDDDLFAHALILRDGKRLRLFQGLDVVTVDAERVGEQEHNRLIELLGAGIPQGWNAASYQGYNFITNAEGTAAREIAVFGTTGAARPPGSYFAAPPTSEIGELVKTISQVD